MPTMPAGLFPTTADPFTEAFLDETPDDTGLRYELSYGTLVVTPSPTPRHQQIVVNVASMLKARCPTSLAVLVEVDVRFQADLVKRPDVVVVDRAQVTGTRVTGTPHLVVEVHSPATRVLDLTERRFVYAERGVPAYWMVDPAAETVTLLELRADRYVEVAVLRGGETCDLTTPFPVRVDTSVVFD